MVGEGAQSFFLGNGFSRPSSSSSKIGLLVKAAITALNFVSIRVHPRFFICVHLRFGF
jgi:hypothetical protein